MNERLDLEASIVALGAGEVVGRRNYEAFREWAKLERDWLEPHEIEHLQRAMIFASRRNKSIKQALVRTQQTESMAGENTDQKESDEPSSLSQMVRELRDLRRVSKMASRDHAELIARSRTDEAHFDAWEARLVRVEEEVLALWDVLEEVIRITSASVPRLEKLEKRVGFQFLRQNKPTPNSASKSASKSASSQDAQKPKR